MQKKVFATLTATLIMLGTLGVVYILRPTQAVSPLNMEIKCRGAVDKKPGESFAINITFRNKGTTEGKWEITATFESEDWGWIGDGKLLTLRSCKTKTLVWDGVVPENAAINSVARLVVYYDNDFTALNWWIRVIPGAELCIVDSKVS